MLAEDIALEGKTVILSRTYYIGDDTEREFVCETGFGCKAKDITGKRLHGRTIFGFFVSDGEKCKVQRFEIERLKI